MRPGKAPNSGSSAAARVHVAGIGDRAARGDGQQLSAEAHPQYRHALLERLLEKVDLGGEEGVLRHPGRTLAPAERDHARDVLGRRERLGVARVSVDHRAACRLQGLADDPVLAVGKMGDDQRRPHEAAG
jgi:hypothetical protein